VHLGDINLISRGVMMKRQSVFMLAMFFSVVVIGFWECVSAVIFSSLGLGFTSWRLRRMKR
jgi:hypothetical protein